MAYEGVALRLASNCVRAKTFCGNRQKRFRPCSSYESTPLPQRRRARPREAESCCCPFRSQPPAVHHGLAPVARRRIGTQRQVAKGPMTCQTTTSKLTRRIFLIAVLALSSGPVYAEWVAIGTSV